MTKDDHYREYRLAELEEQVRAVSGGDHDRRWYWGDVLQRVRQGERLTIDVWRS